MEKEKVVFVIPALNPDEKLLGVVRGLKEGGYERFLLVDDGSDPSRLDVFEKAEALGCHVFHHYKNMGKGRALKDAFNDVYYTFPDFEAVVTLDADGQHLTKDVLGVARETLAHPDCLILGARAFDQDVPLRSKFGNTVTRHVMRLFCGMKIKDTQTGLRGFSRAILSRFLTAKGERYEYELNVLLDAKEMGIAIREVPITTVYIDENRSSHFNPIKDSLRIYSQFLKYIVAAVISLGLDISLFSLFVYLFKNASPEGYIFVSTVIARAISSFVNFLMNKKAVFRAGGRPVGQAVAYYALVVFNVIVSSFAVNYIVKALLWWETPVKLCVDTVLFFFNFFVQKTLIFRKGREA